MIKHSTNVYSLWEGERGTGAVVVIVNKLHVKKVVGRWSVDGQKMVGKWSVSGRLHEIHHGTKGSLVVGRWLANHLLTTFFLHSQVQLVHNYQQ